MSETLYHIEAILEDTQIQIWRLEYYNKDKNLLDKSILTEKELKKYEQFDSDKRKLEFLYTRILLKHINQHAEIFYNSRGRPFVEDGHLSISHSKNQIIIAHSETHLIGVDIEYYNDKIFRVQDKFLHPTEKENFNCKDSFFLTLIWSLKEAIYKMEDIPGLSFKENIIVQPLEEGNFVVVHKAEQEHLYSFDYLENEDFIVTYCCVNNFL